MNKDLITIGRVENVSFPELGLNAISARIDTGARTSSVWASKIKQKDGILTFTLFDSPHEAHTGKVVKMAQYEQRMIASSNGHIQQRYVVKLLINLKGRKIRGAFTLADRSTQVYPVLVGRNVLLGKFVVDVRFGQPLNQAEKTRSQELQQGQAEQES